MSNKKLRLNSIRYTCFIIFLAFLAGCSTTKSKSEVGGVKKFYHNLTSKYNGYFNANELMDESLATLDEDFVPNYSNLLPVYEYTAVDDPRIVAENMDKVIEKAATLASVHDVGNYVDDSYLLIGTAQYVKGEYANAEESLEYFREVFDPLNPYGYAYLQSKKEKSRRAQLRMKKIERKQKTQERKEEFKEREKERKERMDDRKEKMKEREGEMKDKRSEQEDRMKDRQKELKERKKENEKLKKKSKKRKKITSADRKRMQAEREAEDKRRKLTEENRKKQETTDKFNKKLEEERLKVEEEQQRLEEEKKKEREAEEEKYKNQGEGAMFKNRTSYTMGLYWLARTYIERERYVLAESMFNAIEDIPGLDKKVEKLLPAGRADLALRTRNYGDALVYIDQAVEFEKDRNEKARLTFLKAQLNEQKGNYSQAFADYKSAKKIAKDQEIVVNANLNELKLTHKRGQLSDDALVKKLESILNDKQNRNYRDQVYLTMAKVYVDQGKYDLAKANFDEAINRSQTSSNKRESYFHLAELLFKEEQYLDANDNFKKALDLMSKKDDRYRRTKRLTENLRGIATQSEIINTQDSLMRLSVMPEDQLREKIEGILYARKKNNENRESSITATNVEGQSRNPMIRVGRSSFFAYNPIVVRQGKVEFESIWGERVLEDNWRRSLRPDASSPDIVSEDGDEGVASVDSTQKAKIVITDEEIDQALKGVPRNAIERKLAQGKIQEALLKLAKLFRERLQNNRKAIVTINRLLQDYPDFEDTDEALFYLHLSYHDEGQDAEATQVLTRLKREYPESKYTILLTNPEYYTNNEDDVTIESYYRKTLKMFDTGSYSEVIERSKNKENVFPGENQYDPHLALLLAMSRGQVDGKEAYQQSLDALIRKYPDTEQSIKAKEILRFLRGDATAFDAMLFKEDVQAFKVDEEQLHYVFVVFYEQAQKDFQRFKVDITNYNKKFHRFQVIKLINSDLNIETKARGILLRSFDNKEKAMAYFNGVEKRKNLFIKKKVDYDIFAVNQFNYREIIKQKTVTNYTHFFNKEYLGKK